MQIEKIVDSILSELGLSITDTVSSRSDILCMDIIHTLIISTNIKETAILLNIGESGLEHILHRHFKPLVGKASKEKWDYWLLSLINMRRCSSCHNILNLTDFGSYVKKSVCLSCDNARSKEYRKSDIDAARLRSRKHYENNKKYYFHKNAIRRAKQLNATPSWADIDKIKEIYINCPEGYHVDHIVPLQGELVSGLHVEYNLQYLTAEDNLRKSNKFLPE